MEHNTNKIIQIFLSKSKMFFVHSSNMKRANLIDAYLNNTNMLSIRIPRRHRCFTFQYTPSEPV